MGITLDTPTSSGPPAVKFPAVGTSVVVGLVDVEEYAQHNIDGVAQTWNDGTPKMGKRIYGLVVSADGAQIGGDTGDAAVAPGTLVTFYAEKGKHFTWADALKEHGNVEVGDVMQWRFDHEKPATQRGYNPQKVYVAQIRGPKADDGDLADRCMAARQTLKERPSIDAAPVDDDPFGVDTAPVQGAGYGPAPF